MTVTLGLGLILVSLPLALTLGLGLILSPASLPLAVHPGPRHSGVWWCELFLHLTLTLTLNLTLALIACLVVAKCFFITADVGQSILRLMLVLCKVRVFIEE